MKETGVPDKNHPKSLATFSHAPAGIRATIDEEDGVDDDDDDDDHYCVSDSIA